ncbi:MAG: hypothetical protein JSR47_08710 [Proteobacteria bacterium]|nr:hypothetical protein [Pseudomonadota bacterium]
MINSKPRLFIDGSGYNNVLYILLERTCPPITAVDAIQGVEVLGELSQAEIQTIGDEINGMLRPQ